LRDGADMSVIIDINNKLMIVDDEVLPIKHWSQGENTDCHLKDAWGVVAGPDKNGKWHLVDQRDMEKEYIQ